MNSTKSIYNKAEIQKIKLPPTTETGPSGSCRVKINTKEDKEKIKRIRLSRTFGEVYNKATLLYAKLNSLSPAYSQVIKELFDEEEKTIYTKDGRKTIFQPNLFSYAGNEEKLNEIEKMLNEIDPTANRKTQLNLPLVTS